MSMHWHTLMEQFSKVRKDIVLLTVQDFAEKYPSLANMPATDFFACYQTYKSNPWLEYAARPVMFPHKNSFGEFVETTRIYETPLRLNKEVHENNGAYQRQVHLTVEGMSELTGGKHLIARMAELPGLEHAWNMVTTLEVVMWPGEWSLLILHTNVCADYWLGFVPNWTIAAKMERFGSSTFTAADEFRNITAVGESLH